MLKIRKIEVNNHLVAFAIIFLITFSIYWNSLQGDFVWDDKYLILNNAGYLDDWKNLFSVFTKPFFDKAAIYRPLLIVSFIFDYQVWDTNSFGFHCTNVLLHTVNAFLVYLLALFLTRVNYLALLSSLLFITHPIQTEAVAWISGRNDVIVTLFSLLTIIFYIRWCNLKGLKKILTFIAFLTSYGCVLLTKESGIVVILLIILIDYFCKGTLGDWGDRRKAYLSVILVSLLYIYIRMIILGKLGMPISPMGGEFIHRFLGVFVTYTYYFKILLFPIHQTANPLIFPHDSLNDPAVVSALLFILSLVAITLACWKWFWEISFAILWIFITLIPVSGIFSLDIPALEHRLYLGSVSFSIMIPLLLHRLSRTRIKSVFFKNEKAVLFLLLLLIIFIYSSKTVVRNTIWKDENHFWLKTIQDSPFSMIAHNNLGLVYFEKGHYGHALREFEKALSLDPYAANVHANMGVLYVTQRLYQEAINAYRRALMLKPKKVKNYNNLGNLYYQMLKESKSSSQVYPKRLVVVENIRELYQKSLNNYKKALQLDSNDPEVHNNLGDLYYLEQLYPSALEEYKRAVKLNPYYADAYNNLGLVHLKEKNYDDAQKAFARTLELEPNFAEACSNLALVYMERGMFHRALEWFTKASTLMPENAEVYFNLALVYLRGFRDKQNGIHYLEESLRINPHHARAKMIRKVLTQLSTREQKSINYD
ncbi:MAG: hypothetical protein AMJ42_04145 [Deltaproteobacteria bacterium DG_8]|nr:MAG: hypothetical protein AMJ42_04145 [Deltaproteobacteria bacterium DG_8]